jgi:hypothetical protein
MGRRVKRDLAPVKMLDEHRKAFSNGGKSVTVELD